MDEDYEDDRFSDAIRILLLIAAVADDLDGVAQTSAPDNAVAVLHAESRLQKLDFWLRNPDYLADELLNDYERSNEDVLLDLAGTILDSDEPEVCAIPMLRYLFGAFEALDRTLSVLVAPRLLVVTHRRSAQRVLQDTYYLTAKGRAVATQAVEQFPELRWYTERALLVKALADGTGHSALALRRRQYLQRDYAETPLGEIIPSIADRTRTRLARLRAATDEGTAA
ncbi:hypothetical protein [Planobispora takensis]|uniref:Uncharacterized protein n=1 Tax=Planobispora takensis TaxID=1367882 RepID=A0A8J3WQV0_9ACTN|nr:hypothetical protein [Planobispora takensis]GIH99169.1 hypothetical protein Pta02_11780 [Planobispora takensis]